MHEGSLFCAAGIVPSCMSLLSPVSAPAAGIGLSISTDRTHHIEPLSRTSEAMQDASSRLFGVLAESCARWFVAMRKCIGRERVRQQLFREENGLPKTAKIPYSKQPLTSEEVLASQFSESIIRAMFGDGTAEYAKSKFQHAIDTGDMRSFKIRLIMIKARDSLKGTELHKLFVQGIDKCISDAERLAGCIPDPSPRRMSKAEKEKKNKREEKELRIKSMQPELPLEWPDETEKAGSKKDPEIRNNHEELKDKKTNSNDASNVESEKTSTITVMPDNYSNSIYCNGNRHTDKPRKAREYDTVDQILDDIEDGKILPYESSDEICEDLKDGIITPVEAMMFVSAMERYSPSEPASDGEDDDGFDEDDEFGDYHDDEDYEEHEDDRSSDVGSYNPRGFGAVSDSEWGGGDDF